MIDVIRVAIYFVHVLREEPILALKLERICVKF